MLLLPAVGAVYAVAADQPPAPKDSKNALPAEPAKDPGKKPAQAVVPQAAVSQPAPPQALASQPAAPSAVPQPAAPPPAPPAGGMVVFIDPATGQIRQPDASEIGSLTGPAAGPAAKAPEVTLLQGPGGAVGAVLNQDSLTYMVVTTTPDGKIAMDCVTGDKAANARVASTPNLAGPGQAPKAKETPQGQRAQDTHDVKVPR